MPGGFMPYQLEKGPIWSVVESALAQGPTQAYELLVLLRDPQHEIADGPMVTSSSLDYTDPKTGAKSTPQTRGDHLRHDWFGMVKQPSGKWEKEPASAFDPQTHPSTGFWVNYWGDVESIVRETFVRAIEVSLGLKNGETHESRARFRRHWPVSIFMKCPTPWFEGWVSWRSWETNRATDGHVVVHFLVPGNYGSQVLKKPKGGFTGKPNTKPDTSDDPNGMWLIAYETHRRLDGVVTTDPGTAGDIHPPSPGAILKDEDDLIVIAPRETDGGVAPNGRAYVP
ncbi:MAG: hypothetical protein QOD92_123 [Acidimicrobiaceae bacterium]|jgi:hypothetical protein